MLSEMAESSINSITGGPDNEHADVQERMILQRRNEIQRELSEFEFERKRADLSKDSCIKSLCLFVFFEAF